MSFPNARFCPEQVAGLVLIDSPTPNLPAFLTPARAADPFPAAATPGPSLVPGYVNERWDVLPPFRRIDAAGPLPREPMTYLAATLPLDLGSLPLDQQRDLLEVPTQQPLAVAAYLKGCPAPASSASPTRRIWCSSNAPTSSRRPCAMPSPAGN